MQTPQKDDVIAQAHGEATVSILSDNTYHYAISIPTKDKKGLFISRICRLNGSSYDLVEAGVLNAVDGIVNKNVDVNLSNSEVFSKLSFSEAFKHVKTGKGMRLPSWSPEVVIRAQYPDENSKMTAPYLYVESRFGKVPWKETFIELFSNEWEVIN